MPLKIVRDDITKVNTQAIVNTANDHPTVGTGCDYAIYSAAGYDDLLAYRKQNIGYVEEGKAFITPGFKLNAEYIIHAVSPFFFDGNHGEEEKLRSCYKNSLALAKENDISSIAFPLISTGGFGYPKEEGMRIAVDEINTFLLQNKMDIFLVVFDETATQLGENIFPELEKYIDQNYVRVKNEIEYKEMPLPSAMQSVARDERKRASIFDRLSRRRISCKDEAFVGSAPVMQSAEFCVKPVLEDNVDADICADEEAKWDEQIELLDSKLAERVAHKADTFSQYLMYLIQSKGMDNVEVRKRAIIDKKLFSKIKNNQDYHPTKITCLCLCVGAKLNLDETKDLLSRAGYALSPSDLTDIIFSFYIEHEHYDVIDIDIKLEEYDLPCIIS